MDDDWEKRPLLDMTRLDWIVVAVIVMVLAAVITYCAEGTRRFVPRHVPRDGAPIASPDEPPQRPLNSVPMPGQ